MKIEPENATTNICNISYLTEMVHGNKTLMSEIIDEFHVQISEELKRINDALENANYQVIKSLAHTMKSTVSIIGVTILTPLLNEIESLAKNANDIEKIKTLIISLNIICKKIIDEVESNKHKYIETK